MCNPRWAAICLIKTQERGTSDVKEVEKMNTGGVSVATPGLTRHFCVSS